MELNSFGKQLALVDDQGRELSYLELDCICRDLEERLRDRAKALVVVFCKNNVESLVGYLSALRSGHSVLLADAAMLPELRVRLLSAYRPEYVWGPAEDRGPALHAFGSYTLVPYAPAPDGLLIHEALALLLSTSGSTGSPKHVRLTLPNVQANARAISQYLSLSETDRAITNLPIHYSYGLSVVNSHLTVGATLLVTDASITSQRFWEFFAAQRGTSLAGVPFTYQTLRKIGFAKMALPTLRYMTQAGGKMPAPLAREFSDLAQRRGVDLYFMYGQTEATARIAYLAASKSGLKPTSIGQAVPDGRMSLVDVHGNPIDTPGQQGEIVYVGPNVMMGYALDRNDLAKGDDLRGVLRTGDLATMDEEGDFYISGRLRRFVKLFGRRVNLDEVEEWLRGLGYDCACDGCDDLLVVATAGMTDDGAIKRHLRSSFRISASVVRVVRVDTLPRTASGKTRYPTILPGEGLRTGTTRR